MQRLSVAVELNFDLPSLEELQRWNAEPVKLVIIPTTVFRTNSAGYPVLAKTHQLFIKQLMRNGSPDFIISSVDFKGSHENMTLSNYREYLAHLYSTLPPFGVVDKFVDGYHDFLQSPLQPLMDNLEEATYSVFETDPVKYQLYEEAILQALIDRVPKGSNAETVIMIVGAGARGPLVDRCISASKKSGRKVKLYAIEKNPNAIPTLLRKQQDEWQYDNVQIFHVDMRLYFFNSKILVITRKM